MFPESDYEQSHETLFSKGNFVFGICDNELPWPGKISKIYLEKSYGVKFIGHKSFAVLQQSSLLKFDEENINRVVIQYNINDPHRLTKIIKAIQLCKADEAKIARRKERQAHGQKKQSKKITEDGKNHKRHLRNMNDLQQKPLTRRQAKKVLKKNRQSVKKTDSSRKEQSKLSPLEYLPPTCENNQQSIKSNRTISKLVCEIQASKSNQFPSSTPSSQRQLHDNWSRLCVADESLQNSQLSTEETQPVPFYDRQEECQQQEQRQYQQILECKPQQEISEQLKMVPYLKHLISYVSKQLSEPLNKQQKKAFSQLLQSNRRLQYHSQFLSHMVSFILAFNYNHSEERKNCIIEYIKVKERVETMLMLRQKLEYSKATNQILEYFQQSS